MVSDPNFSKEGSATFPIGTLLFAILLPALLILGVLFNYSSTHEKIDCKKLLKETETLIKKANYCSTDSDCRMVRNMRCPFGCYWVLNKEANLENVNQAISKYFTNCEGCRYRCGMLVNPVLKCVEKKCWVGQPK